MRTILLVEDDELLRTLVYCAPSSHYNVLTASDSRMAFSTFHAHSDDIDILLIDAGLPYLNGRDLATMIDGVRPGIKCLVMSGDPGSALPSPNHPRRWWFIAKPFSISDLSTMIEQVLAAPDDPYGWARVTSWWRH